MTNASASADVRHARELFPATSHASYFNTAAVGLASRTLVAAYHEYVDQWAAVASMAPAAFLMQPESLAPVKDKMPLFLAHGDADTVVPIDVGRRWAKAATDLKMKDFKYMELPGADHGTVITQAMPEIFKFFKERTR